MIRASQFQLASVQTVVWTPEAASFSQPRFLATVLGRYAGRYDGSVQSIPLPEEAPAEIPRIVLESSDHTWKLQASPFRCDAFWIRDISSKDVQNPIKDSAEVLRFYVDQMQRRVSRIALVLTRVCETAHPAQTLIERFCNDEAKIAPFNRSEAFEIHNHKRYQLPKTNLQINSWVRCKTATLMPNNNPVVVVEQDINTVGVETVEYDLAGNSLETFFSVAPVEANSILELYFPEEY
jgi:hypothetical protein